MCSAEIRQSYILISAFNRLGKPASVTEIAAEIDSIAAEVAGGSFDKMGEYSIDIGLQELADGAMIELCGRDKLLLTSRGENHRLFQEKFVKMNAPDFPTL